MKVVYLAGPYRAETPNQMHEYQEVARQWACRIWKAGAICICPHLNSRMMDGVAPDHVFVNGYRELVKRSDAVMLLPGWPKSIGAKAEKELAEEKGLHIFSAHSGLWDEFEAWVNTPRNR